MEHFDYEYVYGYTSALLDVKNVFQYIDRDLQLHKVKRSAKTYESLIDVMIKGRAVLRENPDAFVRWNVLDKEFEIVERKNGQTKPVEDKWIN